MASIIVNRGLQVIGGRASNTSDSFAAIQTMSVDDSTNAFTATDTALDDGGAVSNEFDAAFDQTPTRSAQTVTHELTLGTGDFNSNTIKRIALHNDTAGNVTTSSATLVAGIDGQTIAKDSSFSLLIKVDITYTSA